MAELKVKVLIDRSAYDSSLSAINSQLSQLENNPIKLKFEAVGLDTVTKDAIKLAKAQADIEKATAKRAAADARATSATQQRIAAEARLQTQIERNKSIDREFAIQQERTAQSSNKAAAEIAKTGRASQDLAIQQEKTAQSANRVAVQQEKTATAHAKAAQTADQLNSIYNRLGVTMANFVKAKFFQSITSGVNDSISDMKRLDDELVTIRKVSNATEAELDAISDRSFTIGAKYGRSPSDYASGVAEFNRAGYRETADALAELSIKAQLVGDMNAETANQFLLATDAAYQYHGSVVQLSNVLDGMNAIDNNYATSIEKMAAGLGKIAPLASQAGVGVDELTAALGTITAVSQRSGEEAATALRALFLNIMGDTKTEIEDGATWTAGEIEGLRDIMRQYIPEIVEEAERLGKVINPMEAIGALSQAYKDGLINEQELMQQVSDIGGKLRSSQLLTLIRDWDMYESMLSTYRTAAGSADEEITSMLDSWSVKSEQLSTSFTKLMSNFVNADIAKGGLDVLINVVEALDSDFGRAAISAGLLAAGFAGIYKAGSALVGVFANFGKFLGKLGTGGWISLAIAGAGVLYGLIDQLVVDYDELVDKSEESQQAYQKEKDELDAINSELENTNTRIAELQSKGPLSLVEQEELARLQEVTKELELQARLEQLQADAARKQAAYDAAKTIEPFYGRDSRIENAIGGAMVEYRDYAMYSTDEIQELSFLYLNYERLTKSIYDLRSKGADSLTEDEINSLQWYNSELEITKNRLLENANTMLSFREQTKEYYDLLLSIPESERQLVWTPDDTKFVSQYEKSEKIARQAFEIADPEYFSRMYLSTESEATAYVDKYVSLLEEGSEEAENYGLALAELQSQIGDVSGYDSAITMATELAGKYNLDTDAANALLQQIRLLATEKNSLLGETFFPSVTEGSGDGSAQPAEEAASKYRSLSEATKETADKYNTLRRAMVEINSTGRVTEDTLDKLQKSGVDLGNVLQDDVAGGFWVSTEAIQSAGEETAKLLSDLTGADYNFEIDTTGVDAFTEALNEADSALSDLKKRLNELGESGDTFRDFAEMYENALSLYGEGRTGTNAFAGYTGAIFSKEALASAGTDAKARGEMLGNDFISGFFEAAGNGGVALAEYLYENFEEAGGLGASFDKIGDTIVPTIMDLDALSRSTGLSSDVWVSAAGYMQEYSNTLSSVGDNAATAVKEVDEFAGAAEVAAEATGKVGESFDEKSSDNAIVVEADTEEAESQIDTLTDKATALVGDYAMTFTTDTGDSETQLTQLKAIVDAISGVHAISFKVVSTGAIGSAASAAASAAISIPRHAEGTESAKNGLAIVNELGPELIVSKGRAFIAGDGKPTIVDLEAGDIVYTHEETNELLAGRNINGGIASHKAGTLEGKSTLYEKPWSPLFTTSVSSTSSNSKKKKNTSSASSSSSSSSNGDGGGDGGGTSGSSAKNDTPDWWRTVEDYFGYFTDQQQRAIDRVSYQIELLENDLEDLSKPIEKEVDQLERLNDQLNRQVELLERQRENAVEPLRKQVDEMRKAKDVQDEQLELAERQKAVEEARNELQNAQNERTIRYFNAQKGQWEWMADKGRIADAEEALSAAEKDLADYEYEMRIKALESQIEQIESVYQDRIDEIEDTQLSNDDRIYDLEQQLLALEDAYNNAIEPYEAKMTELERQLKAIEEQWAEAEMPYNAPEDDLSQALANIGGTEAEKNAVSSAINALKSVANGNYSSVAQATAKTVSVAPTKSTSAQYNEILSEMGVMLGAAPVTTDSASYTNTSNTSTVYDYSGSVSIGGITVSADPKTTTLADLVEEVGIYVEN